MHVSDEVFYTFIDSCLGVEMTRYKYVEMTAELKRVKKNLPLLDRRVKFYAITKLELSEEDFLIILSGGRSRSDDTTGYVSAY